MTGGMDMPGGWTMSMMWMRMSGQTWPAAGALFVLVWLVMMVAMMLQFTRWKSAGLEQCRIACLKLPGWGPGFLMAGWKHGIREGLSCVKCCSGLMLNLVAVGVMNPIVMILVAAAIFLEKLLPRPQWVVRGAGFAAIAAGVVVVVMSLL